MKITWNKVLWFAAGAVVGAAVTGKYFKTKYERLYQKDVEDVKRAFSMPQQSEPTNGDTEDVVENESESAEVNVYAEIVNEQGYDTGASAPVNSIGKEVKGVARPYVIPPVEFDTVDDYEVFTIRYFADGTLADEMGNVIEDIDSMVGRDALTHFGEYEDDAVHVRNDALQCDFEILRDLDKYSDIYHAGPRPNED